MPFTTVAFYQVVDLGGAWGYLAAIKDQHVYTEGNDLTVPTLSQIVALSAGVGAGGDELARLVSPSLRGIGRYYIHPVNGGLDADAEPDADPKVIDLRTSPVPLSPAEQLNAEAHSDTTAAEAQWVIVWLADGPVTPVTGDIRTIRATNTDTLTAGEWTNGNITLDEDLPVGTYQVVGMRALSAGLVAARLVFRGGAWRPGCLACDDPQDQTHSIFRYGNLGVWGEFPHNMPPSVDFLSISADADQEVFLDIIKIA